MGAAGEARMACKAGYGMAGRLVLVRHGAVRQRKDRHGRLLSDRRINDV